MGNFLTPTNHEYPRYNKKIFEEYFYNFVKTCDVKTERIILPVLWTNFYISRNYGNSNISDLQHFLDSLDRKNKYYTVVQWDDNILNDLKDLDIKIFCQGGFGKYKDKCVEIPLLCNESPLSKKLSLEEKNVFCSFIGCIKGRHVIREQLRDILRNDPRYFISENINYDTFKDIMNRSIFSLCPRGYGQTSFRICEALQSNSIPVYVYDTPIIPFKTLIDFNEYGVLIPSSDIININDILSSMSKDQIISKLEKGKTVYEEFFKYESCAKKLINLI